MDGNVPWFNLFSEENQDWHLEDLDLIQTRQLIFSNKPAISSNNRFADDVSTTEFEKRISDRIPKKTPKNANNWAINGQSRGIVTQQQQWKTIHLFPLTL
jgi:hypothetical protein